MAEKLSPEKRQELRNNPSFCAHPFVQVSTVPAGFYRPCCYYTKMLTDEFRQMVSVKTHTPEQIWNGREMREIRTKMLRGEKVKNCDQCYAEEALGKTSMRNRSFDEWGNAESFWNAAADAMADHARISTPAIYYEIKPGNLCNLKCRMCNQFDSSSIAGEMKILAEKYQGTIKPSDARLFDPNTFTYDFSSEQMPDWSELPEFWDCIERALPHIECLSFAGGEPTLIPEVHKLLEKCVSSGYAMHIRVYFSSNFTRLDESLFELSRHFKVFDLIASLDGMGPVQEYIRFPSKWETVSRNFLRADREARETQSFKLSINLTVEIYNILSFTDLLDWLEVLWLERPETIDYPFALNLLYNPRHLSYEILPPAARPVAIARMEAYLKRSKVLEKCVGLKDRLNLIIHQLRQPPPADYEVLLKRFWGYTKILDGHRKQKLQDVDPLLYSTVADEIARLESIETHARMPSEANLEAEL